jgi:hypothetical protein
MARGVYVELITVRAPIIYEYLYGTTQASGIIDRALVSYRMTSLFTNKGPRESSGPSRTSYFNLKFMVATRPVA